MQVGLWITKTTTAFGILMLLKTTLLLVKEARTRHLYYRLRTKGSTLIDQQLLLNRNQMLHTDIQTLQWLKLSFQFCKLDQWVSRDRSRFNLKFKFWIKKVSVGISIAKVSKICNCSHHIDLSFKSSKLRNRSQPRKKKLLIILTEIMSEAKLREKSFWAKLRFLQNQFVDQHRLI